MQISIQIARFYYIFLRNELQFYDLNLILLYRFRLKPKSYTFISFLLEQHKKAQFDWQFCQYDLSPLN
jgi:hypothetical protein